MVTTSIPSFTCPNTTCLPSSLSKERLNVTSAAGGLYHIRDYETEITNQKVLKSIYHSVLVVQMKNWEPFVFGPEFAIERVPAEIRILSYM